MNTLTGRLELPPLPNFFSLIRVGDTVEVNYRVREGEKERIQVFRGIIIRIRKGGSDSMFTVRKISHGVGVERIFPTMSPLIADVKILSRGHVRRARLYYLRGLKGKRATRLKGTVAYQDQKA
jgi:large subunit ribosomal protein L19